MMKLTIIKTLINNELSFEKIQASIRNINEQINNLDNCNLILLLNEDSDIKSLITNEVEQINNKNIQVKSVTSEFDSISAEQLIAELETDYITIQNGGDKFCTESIAKLNERITNEDLIYLKYFAPNYRGKVRYEYSENNEVDANSSIIWEHVNNKIISRELIMNNKLDLSTALNDDDKQELYMSAYLSSKNTKVFSDCTYLNLQGNDEEYEMFEEYEDDEYFEKLQLVFDLINHSSVPNEDKEILKANFLTFEFFEGQNADKLKDTNKEEDAVKQKYLDKLALFLQTNTVEKWSKNLSLESQGIVRVISTKNLVNVANKMNLFLIYKEYENYKVKIDRNLKELENKKSNQEEKIDALLSELQGCETKIEEFNNKFSKVELKNLELSKMLRNKDVKIEELTGKNQNSKEKVEEYKTKLVQAKELFTQQEETNSNLKGKINELKVLVQERDIEISRINLELEYLKSAFEENEKVISTHEKTNAVSVDTLKNEKKELEEKYQILEKKYQELEIKEEQKKDLESVDNNEAIKLRCEKLERENKILRNGYDDLAEKLKLNRNMFKGLFKHHK